MKSIDKHPCLQAIILIARNALLKILRKKGVAVEKYCICCNKIA